MKRVVPIVVAALAIGAAATVLPGDGGAPLPSARSLATYGFAVWPEDTVDEGAAACVGGAAWRRDARATAHRFAATILRYPAPEVGAVGPVRDHVRYLVNSRRMGGLSLGSVLDLRRHGDCWFVVAGQPREGDLVATLAFVRRGDEAHLLLSHPDEIPQTRVGYGTWDEVYDDGALQVVIPLPDLSAEATGHVIFTSPEDSGVSESVGATTLGAIPRGEPGPAARALPPSEVRSNAGVCRMESTSFRSARAAIRHLYEWTFDALLEQVDGFPTYDRRAIAPLHGDVWRLRADSADLRAVIPRIAGRCFKIVAMKPTTDPPIRSLHITDRTVTFDLDWGGADEALIAYGTRFDGRGGTLHRIDQPVTFQRKAPPQPHNVPTYALVVLYEDEHIVSAQYGLYEPG